MTPLDYCDDNQEVVELLKAGGGLAGAEIVAVETTSLPEIASEETEKGEI